MKRIRKTVSGLILLLPVTAVFMAFQNCSGPVAIEEGGIVNASERPTPTPTPDPFPGSTPVPTPTPTPSSSSGWEGSCVSRSTDDPMAWAGPDTGTGILTAFTSGGRTALWFHTDAVISARVCQMNGSGWSVKGLANVDGIAQRDVIWRNADGRIAVWGMYGSNRQYGAILANTASSDWKLEGSGDFNFDGKEDLVFRNADGRVQIWLMNGLTVGAISEIGFVPSNWHTQAIADFNGDRKADLLFRKDTGEMEIWFMNGVSITAKTPVSHSGANPNPAALITAGDFDGDGISDLMFEDGSGNISFWKMNGAVGTPDPRLYTAITTVPDQTVRLDGDAAEDLIMDGGANGANYLYAQHMHAMAPYIRYTVGLIQPGWTVFRYDRY